MIARTTNPINANSPVEGAVLCGSTTKHGNEHNLASSESKTFSTLRAKFALLGHTLHTGVNADATIVFLAGRSGYFKELKNLEAATAFLILVGGSL